MFEFAKYCLELFLPSFNNLYATISWVGTIITSAFMLYPKSEDIMKKETYKSTVLWLKKYRSPILSFLVILSVIIAAYSIQKEAKIKSDNELTAVKKELEDFKKVLTAQDEITTWLAGDVYFLKTNENFVDILFNAKIDEAQNKKTFSGYKLDVILNNGKKIEASEKYVPDTVICLDNTNSPLKKLKKLSEITLIPPENYGQIHYGYLRFRLEYFYYSDVERIKGMRLEFSDSPNENGRRYSTKPPYSFGSLGIVPKICPKFKEE
jgi:hypothetical protein